MDKKPFTHFRKGQRLSASEYNRLTDIASGLVRSLHTLGFADSTGFHTRRQPVPSLSTYIKIFAVQSEAAGDGVYDCYEQTLDATEWDDTAGDPKFDDLDAVEVEVLNLAEFNPEAEYVAHLAAGDLIVAWQKTDDEGNKRWIGVPFRQGAQGAGLRNAYCKDDAGAGSTIVCYLDTDGTGTEITVNCSISNGSDLNTASRRLKGGTGTPPTGGDRLAVYKVGDTWYSAEGFDTDEECVCTAL